MSTFLKQNKALNSIENVSKVYGDAWHSHYLMYLKENYFIFNCLLKYTWFNERSELASNYRHENKNLLANINKRDSESIK